MTHPLQCRCGTLKGFINHPRSSFRVVCYCKDCQAFAHFLGREKDVLDERGASEVIQLSPKNVTITQGIEKLACIRLKQKGLLRWYASCCNTPIGSMLASRKFSFVGLSRPCVENPARSQDDAFGPVRAWVHTNSAGGNPKPRQAGLGTSVGFFIATALKARLNGDYKLTPFFHADTGLPVATPRVLGSEELASVMSTVRAATG